MEERLSAISIVDPLQESMTHERLERIASRVAPQMTKRYKVAAAASPVDADVEMVADKVEKFEEPPL